jgi:predicted phosphodiesterase
MHVEVGGCQILLRHGAPWDVDQYVYPDATQELLQRCSTSGIDFVVLGHTHYSMDKKLGRVRIVNPGSVGQPRNRQPGAHWAFLDTKSGQLEFKVEQYDRAPLIRECRSRHPELPYLAEILERV